MNKRRRLVIPLCLVAFACSCAKAPVTPSYVLGAEDAIKAEVMDRRFRLWDSQTVETPDGDLRLAAYKDWVYIERGKEGIYRKLVPGICPQWIPRHEGQPDRWFYVFVPVGFDSKSELWIASTDGYYVGKADHGYFFANSTPVLSLDGRAIAGVVRPLLGVQGNRWQVTVIRKKPLADGQQSTQDWIYEADNVEIQDLRFEDNDTVSFRVIQDGQEETKTISLKSPQPSPEVDR